MAPKLVVVIDTEEDWIDGYEGPPTVANVADVPAFQAQHFDPLGIKPVYLINYPVATDAACVAVFKELLASGACEVGTHVHNWTSPPFTEEDVGLRTYHTAIDRDLEKQKIADMTRIIEDSLGVRPVTFKGGRWGVDGRTIRSLAELGYRVDTSVCPVTDFRPEGGGPDFFDAPFDPYLPDGDDVLAVDRDADPESAVLEMPVSIGFARPDFDGQRRLLGGILKRPLLTRLKLVGLLYRLGVVRRIKLSQEASTFAEMKQLIDATLARGGDLLHMTFHSCILRVGTSPYSRTAEERDERTAHMAAALEYMVRERGAVPTTAAAYRDEWVARG